MTLNELAELQQRVADLEEWASGLPIADDPTFETRASKERRAAALAALRARARGEG